MFWHSVQQGLAVLLHWQTYVAMLEFLLIMMAPRILIGLTMERYPAVAAIGCLMPLLFTAIQLLAVIVFVLTLAPLIFGRTDGAAWSFPWMFMTTEPATFIKLLLMTGVTGILLSLVRLDLFANALMGCLVLAFVAKNIGSQVGVSVAVWPGFWFMVGILIVSGVLFYVGLLITAGIASLFGENSPEIGQMVAFPLSAVLMFLPVFIYGGWLLQQMRST